MNIEELRAPLAVLGGGAWIVGGCVRDAMLGRSVADVDIAVAGDASAPALRLARSAGAGRFALSNAFGAWRVQGGRLPFPVDITPLQGADVDEDLSRRDLTINAIALPVSGPATLIDPHGGLGDLEHRVIRTVRPDAMASDPVRVLRAARLGRLLGFTMEPATLARARAAATHLWDTSAERLRDELYRCVQSPDAAGVLGAVDAVGALGVLVPQLGAARGMGQTAYHHLDVLGHTLEVVQHTCAIADDPARVFRGDAAGVAEVLERPLADGLTRRDALVLAALLHDMAKPETRTTFPDGRVGFPGHDRLGAVQAGEMLDRLRAARRVRELVVTLVGDHLRLGFMVHRQPLSLVQVDRYLRATAPAEVEQLVLSVSDRLATDGPRTTRPQIDRHLDLARQVMRIHADLLLRGPVRPPVPGDELARRLGREPGPWLAEVLAHLREVQLVRTLDPDRAVRIASEWLEKRAH